MNSTNTIFSILLNNNLSPRPDLKNKAFPFFNKNMTLIWPDVSIEKLNSPICRYIIDSIKLPYLENLYMIRAR